MKPNNGLGQTSRTRHNTVIITLLSSLGVFAGVLFQIIVVARIGLSSSSDAFFVAYTIPLLFYAVMTSVQQVLVTAFSRHISLFCSNKVRDFVNSLLTLGLIVFCMLTILFVFLAPMLSIALAPGLEEDIRTEVVLLFRIMVLGLPFSGLALIGSALLAAREQFLAYSSQNAVRYTIAFVTAILLPTSGATGIAIGLVVGAAAQWVIISLCCYVQISHKYGVLLEIRTPEITETLRTVLAASQAMLVRQMVPFSNRILASFLVPGSITLIEIAGRLQGPATSVFFDSIVSAHLPKLSAAISRVQQNEILNCFRSVWRYISFTSVTVTALLLTINQPLLRMLYTWGEFTANDVQLLVPLSFAYNLGLLFRGYISLIMSFLYAANLRRNLITLNVFMTVIDIGLKLALLYWFGAIGIAIAFTISLFVTIPLGIRFITSSYEISIRDIELVDIKLVFCGVLSFAIGYFFVSHVTNALPLYPESVNNVIACIVGSSVVLFCFAVYILIFVPEIHERIALIKYKFGLYT